MENTAGTVNWGLTFHRHDPAFQSKSDAFQDAAAWFADPGDLAVYDLTRGFSNPRRPGYNTVGFLVSIDCPRQVPNRL